MIQETVVCSECGRVYVGKIPKGGDGFELHPRRHTITGKRNGPVCLGSYLEAKIFINYKKP